MEKQEKRKETIPASFDRCGVRDLALANPSVLMSENGGKDE